MSNPYSQLDSLVRRLDVALNGEEGAAKQASLCDIVGQVEDIARKRGPVLTPAFDFCADALAWGNALNEAAWVFVDVCPEKSVRLFNHSKPALRAAILKYAEAINVAALSSIPATDQVKASRLQVATQQVDALNAALNPHDLFVELTDYANGLRVYDVDGEHCGTFHVGTPAHAIMSANQYAKECFKNGIAVGRDQIKKQFRDLFDIESAIPKG